MSAWHGQGSAVTDTADVVIVGAGIMGVSTAYHLARRRAGRVVVVERDGICEGSTALASGGIRHQYANRIGIELTLNVIETFERFEDEFGVDPQFRQHGYLILAATEAELALARRNLALQRSLGVDVTLLSPEETGRRFPYLDTRDLLGASYSPRDGYADPYLVTTAMAARARELGVEIRTGTEVTGVRRSATRVEGVTTSAGAIDARVVVLAAGAWSEGVGRLAGIDVPVSPLRRSKFITAPFPFERIPEATPFIIDTHQGISMRREGAGLLLGIGRRDDAPSFDTHPGLEPHRAPGRARRAPRPRAGRRLADARVGRALRDDAGSDGHPERGAGGRGPPRDCGLQRPRLHARAHRGPAHGRADRRRARHHRRHRAARPRPLRTR